jgi:NACHT domain-containing protein
MFDIEKIINALQKVLNWIFQGQVPPWILRTVGYALAVGFFLLGVWGLLFVLGKIKKLWIDEFKPLFYDPKERRRSLRRRRFADHIESEIRRLNNLEAWSDYRFAELEAEVEAEGSRRALFSLPSLSRGRRGLRRERSLSRALEVSRDRLITLEGEPGAGKSVALRYVAQRLARKANRSRSTASIIPIYVNLKELERSHEQPIDQNLIHNFVLKTLNRVNDRDIEEFLEEEFDKGLKESTWLFLFDSFDELPEVLSSTEADSTVRGYTDAISSFLHGLNQCRGVIASRHFRGPVSSGWPRFRILPLSENRKLELIKKVGFSVEVERDFIGEISTASHEVISMAGNPMFLSLICEHIRGGRPFPSNAHTVFETYIQTRLSRDESRIERRFNLSTTELRNVAERTAFCMAADLGLGLSPTRLNLRAAMARQGMENDSNFESVLDALEYIKLARSETLMGATESKPFTFAHRRFQEYFATSIVLADPNRVSPNKLLIDARWRETAVVMCQSQPLEVLLPLISRAQELLGRMAQETPEINWDPEESDFTATLASSAADDCEIPDCQLAPRAIHILGLLQDGFGGRLKDLPEDLREHAGRLIIFASVHGVLYERKWALQVAGIVPKQLLLVILRRAFFSNSQWLKDTAYRQTARLGEVPSDIASAIRGALVDLSLAGRLRQERYATNAHLSRFDKSSHFLSILRLLVWVPLIDFLLVAAAFILLASVVARGHSRVDAALLFLGFGVVFYAIFKTPELIGNLRRRDLAGAIGLIFDLRLFFLITVELILSKSRIIAVFRDPASIIGAIIICILIGWTPMAWNQALRGRFVHPIYWPFIPMFRVVHIPSRLRDFLKMFVLIGWQGLVMIGVFVLMISPIGLLSQWGFLVMLVTFGGLFVLVGIYSIVHWINDRIRWIKWKRVSSSVMSGGEFLKLCIEFRFDGGRCRLIRDVREKDLLLTSEESESVLANLAWELELEIRTRTDAERKEPVFTFAAFRRIFKQIYDQYIAKDKRKRRKWGPVVLDEVNILLEQVRAKRPSLSGS